jgi:uncharacterized membrane protein YqgA involved in biofilm formation
MIGTLINVAGIILGGMTGLTRKTPFSVANQNRLKLVLGVLTAICGLWLVWISLNGPFLQVLKHFVIVLVALSLGKLIGRLLHLQKISNRAGRFARDRMNAATLKDPNRFTHGFLTCSLLFCIAPLSVLGAVSSGLSGYFYPLVIKAIMDGLAVMGFISIFGRGVILSAVPVLVFQGTITLLCARFLQPALGTALIDSINATGGLLIFCVALIILEIRKIEVADYLPSLVIAPLLVRWLH